MKFMIIAALSVLSTAAFAAPDSLTMTCASAKAYIDQNGTATLATGDLFADFTAGVCGYGLQNEPAYVRTSDAQFCYVGSYCANSYRGGGATYFQGTDNACTNGAKSTGFESENGGARGTIQVPVQIVCVNGNWVYPDAAAAAPAPATCTEGKVVTSFQSVNGGARGPVTTTVEMVCHNNQWVVLN